MRYKVERKQIIMMGIRSMYFEVDAESPEEAEEIAENLSSLDAYDIEHDIEETEDLEIIIEEK